MGIRIVFLICLILFSSCEQRCKSVNISKGPYVLFASGGSAEIRWETLEEGCPEIVLYIDRVKLTSFKGQRTKYTMKEGWERNYEVVDGNTVFYNYYVRLSGLERGKRYQYKIKGDSQKKYYSFRASPDINSAFTFAVIGDTFNVGEGYEGNISNLEKLKPDLLIHTGDLEYYLDLADSWIKFFKGFGSILSYSVFFPVRGNHEKELTGEYENYFLRFFGNFSPESLPFNYFIEFGKGIFIALDSEGENWDSQKSFLEVTLSDFSNRVTDGLKVVTIHRPPYTLSEHFPFRKAIEYFAPVFEKYGVNLVFSGHNHVYERFIINGINYVVSGGGGAFLYDANAQVKKRDSGKLTGEDENLINDIFPKKITGISSYHTVYCSVFNDTVTATAIDYKGNVLDKFELNLH